MSTNIEITNTESMEQVTQYILDEHKKLVEIPKNLCKPVVFPINYRLSSAFEVFVRVNRTENYWISNYGRCVNNLNHKDKNTFYEHKTGKCHYSVFEIEKYIVKYPFEKCKNGKIKIDESKTKQKPVKMLSLDLTEDECNVVLDEFQNKDENNKYIIKADRNRRETSPELLVAEHFLASNRGGDKVWHKDGDEGNNWYKNLIIVTASEYKDLQSGKISYEDLEPKQEYIEYENKASANAYRVYNGIRTRCGDTTENDNIGKCYDGSNMCQEWLDNPKSFLKWFFEHYYEVEGEDINIDKDLFGDGSGTYCPEFCCILPKCLNTLLANSKRHYITNEPSDTLLPYGVKYNSKNNKYFSEIQLTGTQKQIRLSEYDTPDEAFAEYKKMKEADILIMAAKYRERIPDYIYNKLLAIEVKPY